MLRQFLVREGLENAPELAAVREAIAVQERRLRSLKSSFFLPTIAAQGELSNVIARRGAGSQLPPQGGDATWNVGVQASLPIFEGGSRFSQVREVQKTLDQLKFQEAAARDRIEQRIRSALHQLGGSFASIRLSQNAAEAAKKGLDLTVDAYSRGVVSILDLLDAQNAALVSEQASASAVYDFLIDMMEVERSVGQFTFFLTSDAIEEKLNRLDAFFRESEGS